MSGISDLIAAQLSKAAYTPLSDYQLGKASLTPIAGWTVNTALSGTSPDGANQFITFVNDQTHQAVTAFKGSDNVSNFESDLLDSGASAWASIRPKFETALNQLQAQGYTVITDGQSLGGGLSQTADLF